MKKMLKALGIAAIIAVIGFSSLSLTGCGDSGGTMSSNQTPIAADYDIGNLKQAAGSVTDVTITPKSGKSEGTITIYYNGSTTLPQTGGTYPVTFDVAAVTGWNAASGLSAGVLTVGGESKESAITLTLNQWADGELAEGGEEWFKFTATTAEAQFIHFQAGTLDYVYVQVYDNTGAAIGDIALMTSNARTPRTVTLGSEYYIKATPSYGSGTYKITFNDSQLPPPSLTLPTAGVTTLTLNTWADGNLAADGEQWFKFTATADLQYIHFDPGTLSTVFVQVYDNTGAAIGGNSILGGTLYSLHPVTLGSEYYIKVTPGRYSNGSEIFSGSGTYKITFNDSQLPPPSITLPTTGVTTLTLNTWTDGELAADGEQWFKFTGAAVEQQYYTHLYYIHFDMDTYGTLAGVYVQVYYDTGAANGAIVLMNNNTTWSWQVTPGSEYYIKVTPAYDTYGAYKIAFNDSQLSPPSITLPTTGITQLTPWADGNLAEGGEQWFKFTATDDLQYIYFDSGTLLSGVYVQVYDNTGVAIGGRQIPDFSIRNITSGSEYYIKVTPRNSSDSGTYKIAFNASATLPPITLPTANVTTLTAGTWADGSIAEGDEQWFKFTATDDLQYIHLDYSNSIPSGVCVQVYDNTGLAIGSRASLYNSIGITVTSDSEYYIKVTPDYFYAIYGTIYGAYKIAFNDSATAPQ